MKYGMKIYYNSCLILNFYRQLIRPPSWSAFVRSQIRTKEGDACIRYFSIKVSGSSGMSNFKIKENSGNGAYVSFTMSSQIRFSIMLLLKHSSKHYTVLWIFIHLLRTPPQKVHFNTSMLKKIEPWKMDRAILLI